MLMKKQNGFSKLVSNNPLQHAGYLAVAKTRAKVLKAFAYIVPIRRPMLFIGETSCEDLCDMLINEGHTNVFIVTDAVLNKLGIPAKVTDYLDKKISVIKSMTALLQILLLRLSKKDYDNLSMLNVTRLSPSVVARSLMRLR